MKYHSMMDFQYKVDINPSYEWEKEAEGLGISHKELEVIALVVEGYKNKEIAKILKIQHQSVKNHLQHLFKKLNVKNSTQAYIIALNLNLIKIRGAVVGREDVSGTEIKAKGFIDDLRKIISGEIKVKEFSSEKRKQWLRVFLKEHGIEPYKWGDDK